MEKSTRCLDVPSLLHKWPLSFHTYLSSSLVPRPYLYIIKIGPGDETIYPLTPNHHFKHIGLTIHVPHSSLDQPKLIKADASMIGIAISFKSLLEFYLSTQAPINITHITHKSTQFQPKKIIHLQFMHQTSFLNSLHRWKTKLPISELSNTSSFVT